MKIYVVSRRQLILDLWAGLLPASTSIEFVNKADRSVQASALVMTGIWAFSSYGGESNGETVQMLPNTTGNGLPEWIVVPPSLPFVQSDGSIAIRNDHTNVDPAYYAILESLQAVRSALGDASSVALDLPMIGMDDPRDESTPAVVGRAIEDFLSE